MALHLNLNMLPTFVYSLLKTGGRPVMIFSYSFVWVRVLGLGWGVTVRFMRLGRADEIGRRKYSIPFCGKGRVAVKKNA